MRDEEGMSWREAVMYCYKSSAVAEMGDRVATIDMIRKVGTAVSLSVRRAGSPSNTMSPGRDGTGSRVIGSSGHRVSVYARVGSGLGSNYLCVQTRCCDPVPGRATHRIHCQRCSQS